MYRLLQYYGKYRRLRGGLGGLPGWARVVIFVAALPGIVLVALSILAFLVSLLVLLLLTVPTYRLLAALAGGGGGREEAAPNPWGTQRSEESEFTPADHSPVDVSASVVSDEAVGQAPGTSSGQSPPVDEPPRPRRQVDVKIIE